MNVIEQHSPIIYFHSKEKYLPITKTLLDKIDKYSLSIQDQEKEMYCFQSEKFRFDNKEYFFLTYYIVFTFNDGFLLGKHALDIEYITIQFENNRAQRYFLSSHGRGNWFDNNEIEKENKRPVIYSARYSHAFYNKAQSYRRFFGIANDTTEKGIRYDNYKIIIIPDQEKDSIYSSKFMTYKKDTKIKQVFPFHDIRRRNPLYYNSQYKFQGGMNYILRKVPKMYLYMIYSVMLLIMTFQIVKIKDEFILIVVSIIQGFLITFIFLS